MSESSIGPENIEVGQIWESRDKRDHGRRVEVLEVDDSPYGNGFVVVKGFVKSRVRRHNLPRYYRLVTS